MDASVARANEYERSWLPSEQTIERVVYPRSVTASKIKIDTLTGQSAGTARGGDAELWPGRPRTNGAV